jgi:hypothetical protein
MTGGMRWLLVLPLAVMPGAGVPEGSAAVAAPRVIMVYGEPLAGAWRLAAPAIIAHRYVVAREDL